jgi:putative membrane protein
MIENVRKYPVATVIVLSVYYLIGVIGLSMEMSRQLFQNLIPATLLFSLYFLWLFDERQDKRMLYLGGVVVFLLGFLIEVAGVKSGLIFGHYEYGKTLGIKVLETPLMIGVNWLLLIYSGKALIGLFTSNRWLSYLAGGTILVLYDFALEPAAIRFDMWTWFNVPVPLHNYIGWFIVSFVFFAIFDIFVKRIENKIAPAMFIIQFLFFVLLDVVNYFV